MFKLLKLLSWKYYCFMEFQISVKYILVIKFLKAFFQEFLYFMKLINFLKVIYIFFLGFQLLRIFNGDLTFLTVEFLGRFKAFYIIQYFLNFFLIESVLILQDKFMLLLLIFKFKLNYLTLLENLFQYSHQLSLSFIS